MAVICGSLGPVVLLTLCVPGLMGITIAAVDKAEGIQMGASHVNMTFIVQTLNQIVSSQSGSPVVNQSDLQQQYHHIVNETAEILNLITQIYDQNQLLLQKIGAHCTESVCEENAFFYAETPEECGSCYRFDLVFRNWNEARSYCRKQGGDLVSIETPGENDFLTNITQNHHQPILKAQFRRDKWLGFWTSGSDKKQEGTWVWKATGSALIYTNWASGEPDNYDANQHFLTLWGTPGRWHGSWLDRAPSEKQFTICETLRIC